MFLRPFRIALLAGLFVLALSGGSPTPAFAETNQCEAPGLVDPFCEAGKALTEKAADVVTAPIEAASGGVVDVITTWVSDGAQWLLAKVVNFIDDSTSPDLTADWFEERYRFMVGLAALVLVPILLIASIRAVMNQDLGQLLRSFFVYLPVAVLGTFVAIFLTRALLAVTDEMSAAVSEGIGGDVSEIFDSVQQGLSSVGATNPSTPSFAVFFAAVFLALGAFFVWLELLIRSAAVTVSVFFLPLMLAGLVWPATARWTRRLAETLVALILSKFVIVAVISLATSALANPGGGGFGSVMGGAALMLMAAFSPMALLKLMPIAEGAAISHLEGMGRKPVEAARPGGSVNQAVSIMRSKVGRAGGSSQAAMSAGAAMPAAAAATAAMGVGSAARRAAKEPGRRMERTRESVNHAEGKERSANVGGRTDSRGLRPDQPGSEGGGRG